MTRIAEVKLLPLRRPLRRPIRTGSGWLRRRDGVLVRLVDARGGTGLGEAAPLPGAGTEALAEARTALRRAAPALIGRRLPRDPGELPALPEGLGPAARFALETAVLDLAARHAGVPLAFWLAGGRPAVAESVELNALVVAREDAALEAEIRALCAAGFRTLKLKAVGAGPAELTRLARARDAAGSGAALRADWNGSLHPGCAGAVLRGLAPVGLEYAEQPFGADRVEDLAALRQEAGVALAADESAASEAAALRVLEAGAADVLVLKPASLGGLLVARRLAERARAHGTDVVVTSLLDGGVGIAAALHLAASLPPPRRACGLATGALLAGDPVEALAPEGGTLRLPRGAGLGLALPA